MRCPDCRYENPDEAGFCMSCGTKLEDSGAKEQSPGHPVSADFVGRQRELGQLVAALNDAMAGRGRLVMLVGEPGIGKTRIAQELAEIAEQRGAQVWWGRCYEEEGAPPYWPWVQPIRAYVQQAGANQLRFEMGAGASDIAQIIPEIHDKLPGLESPSTLDPEQARFRLFDSIATFLKNVSQAKPVVLVLDDLHWADRSSLLLLEFLAPQLGNSPFLVLGTYRDVELSRGHPLAQSLGVLSRERSFQRIALRGLTHDDVVRYIGTAFQSIPQADLVDAIYEQSEGNPLFVTEMTRLLPEGEVWSGRIPEGIREVIGRRLDRLSEDCNRVLTVGSVIGREFGFDQLSRLVDGLSADVLLDVLEEAMGIGIIEEVEGAVSRYQFSHALTQRTLSDELSTTRRVMLHARIAEALEELYGTDVESHAGELAYHFGEAQTVLGTEKLANYSRIAGERALAAFAYEDALEHFERALAAREGQSVDAETATMLFGLARAQAATFVPTQGQQLVDTLRRAFDAFVDLGDTENVVAVASYPHRFGYYSTGTAEMNARALELVPPGSIEAGYLLARYGDALNLENLDFEGTKENLDRALEIARREGDSILEVRALFPIARMHWVQGHFREAVEQFLPVIELAKSLDEFDTLQVARQWCAGALIALGDGDAAQIHATAGLETAERLHNRDTLIRMLSRNTSLAMLKGKWKVAREFIARGLAESPIAIEPLVWGTFLNLQVGNLEKSREYLEKVLAVVPDSLAGRGTEHAFAAATIPLHTKVTGTTDLLDVAESAAREVTSSPSTPNFIIHSARIGLSLIAIQRRDAQSAKEQYSFLESEWGIQEFALISYGRLLGLLAQTMGKLDDAQTHFEDALTFCRKAGYRPELAWTCYDYAKMLFDRNSPGDLDKAASLLDEALSITTELGMKPLNERVLELQDKTQGMTSPSSTETSAAHSVDPPPNILGGTVTILFTDIQDSTPVSERLGDERTQEWLGIHNSIIREQVVAHNGHEVRFQGDGFVLAFPSASDGLRCAKDIQSELERYNRRNTDELILVRMGLHTGEVTWDKDDLYGRSMVLTARISAEAEGGQILVSGLLRELASSRREFVFEGERQLELKGLSGLHTVYELVWR